MVRCFICIVFYFSSLYVHAESYGLLNKFKIHQDFLQNDKHHEANELWVSLTKAGSNRFRIAFISSMYSSMKIDESSVIESCQEQKCSLFFKAKVKDDNRDVIVSFIKKESLYYIASIQAK